MSKPKEKNLRRFVAIYLTSSMLLGGIAYAADSDDDSLYAEGQAIIVEAGNQYDGLNELYGGIEKYDGKEYKIAETSVTVKSGAVGAITGGSSAENATKVHVGTVNIMVQDGNVDYIQGGGEADWKNAVSTVDTVNIKIAGGKINANPFSASGDTDSANGISGGGMAWAGEVENEANTANVKNVNITITGGTIYKATDSSVTACAIWGGGIAGYEDGSAGSVNGASAKAHVDTVNMNISGGTIETDVYGGGITLDSTGNHADQIQSTVDDATINISGGEIKGKVYAGGMNSAKVSNAAIHVSGGEISEDIYGGGMAGLDGEAIVESSSINITGGSFGWDGNADEEGDVVSVYAGGAVRGAQAESQVKTAAIHITNAAIADVYAGGEAATGGYSNVSESAVTVGQGAKIANLQGGGAASGGKVAVGEATLHVGSGAQVNCVQGGGEADGDQSFSYVNAAKITIDGGTIGFSKENNGVFGGGLAWSDAGGSESSVDKASIHMQSGVVNGNIYGGGAAESEAAQGAAYSYVGDSTTVISGGAVHGDVYAGGYAIGNGVAAVDTSEVIVRGGTIDGVVYAGGSVEKDSNGSASVGVGTVTLDSDNAAVKADGGNANTSVLHLTDKVKIYDGKNFTNFNKLRADGMTTITGGFNDANTQVLALTGAGTINADVALQEGKIEVLNGTLRAGTIQLDASKGAELHLETKGNLQTNSGQVFQAAATDGEGKLTADSVGVKDGFTFDGGTLTLDDARYTLDYMQNAGEDAGNTVVYFTGDLVKADGTKITELTVAEAAGGALAKDVKVTAAGSDLTVGGAGTDTDGKNLSAAQLQLVKADVNNIAIENGRQLVLAGTANGAQPLVTNASGELPKEVNLNVDGTLKIGGAGTSGTLVANDTTLSANGTLAIGGGSMLQSNTTTANGTLTIDDGSVLQSNTTTVNGMVAIDGNSMLQSNTTTLGTNGTLEIAGGSAMQSTTLTGDAGATITVGDSSSAGTLHVEEAKLNGATLFLDPVWQGNDQIDQASKASIEKFASGINGTLAVGQNSLLSLGTKNTLEAETAFAQSGLKWGENDITAAMYIGAPQELDASGAAIVVDGSLMSVPGAGSVSGATFAKQSLLMVDVSKLNGGVALKGNGNTLEVAADSTTGAGDGGKLYLANDNGDATYTIVDGFAAGSTVWKNDDKSKKIFTNLLVDIDGIDDSTPGKLTVKTKRANLATKLPGVALPNILTEMKIDTNSANAGEKFLSNAVHMDKDEAIRQINAAARGAEGAGATRLGAVAAWDIADAVQSRLSLAQESEVSGESGIWAQYVHNKDKVDGMGATGGSLNYSNSYNGIVVGGDFARQGNFQSGVAFAYGSGDGSGSALSNDFDFWGLSYYGSVKRGDGNLLFDVGYSKTSSDISGLFEASPDTKVFTFGVRGEKQIVDASGARYVPYVGLRYMNIDTGSYNATMGGGDAFHYGTDKANLWLLPIGVSISSENTSGQWTVRPMADLSYVFAFGDKDSAMRVTTPGVNAADQVGYDIMDSGFFVGRLGIEAAKDNQTWGLGYAYQKGSHAENNRFYANVKFSF